MESDLTNQSEIKVAVNSVTFRALEPELVITCLVESGVNAIEWSGDTHAPPGDLERAAKLRKLCDSKNIRIFSYGSYFQSDEQGAGKGPFSRATNCDEVVQTANALGAKSIRVWAGRMASVEASDGYRKEVRTCLQQICDHTSVHGMDVHLEFHRNTLADSVESTVALLDAVDRKNLFSYWQPRHRASESEGVAEIQALGKSLSHVHVFNWVYHGDLMTREPLSAARSLWVSYLIAASRIQRHRYAIIEFVPDDTLEQFKDDILSLREIINEASPFGQCTV